jgi:hypothetical protein
MTLRDVFVEDTYKRSVLKNIQNKSYQLSSKSRFGCAAQIARDTCIFYLERDLLKVSNELKP